MQNDLSNGSRSKDDSAAPLEDAVAQIPGVRGVRVALDHKGQVTEIHLLASRERAPKQIVRDVQSMLNVTFGLEIDYRVVSVVQLDTEEGTPGEEPVAPADSAGSAKRPAIARISSESHGLSSTVTVEISLGDETAIGTARGPARAAQKLVAMATVDALASILPGLAPEVEHAGIVTVASRDVALVVLQVTTARSEMVLTGSASARRDPHDAVARATLAALNRTLGG